MQRVKLAKVGIALLAIGVISAPAWWYSIGYVLLAWYQAYQIAAFAYALLMVAPSIALTIIGLSSYIAGRNAFWKSHQRMKAPLALLSLALMFVGGFLFAWTWTFSAYEASKLQPPYGQPLTSYLANNSPYFAVFALWFVVGLLILADAVEAQGKEP